ncbi:substrate-binding domain-containing protein [Nitrospira moscoviensis]|uniref:Putative Phosphate-binding protein PstS n=1 Tax=Nitrospira moscoviensis TaxID=42253 RepID=A0A0K2GGM1_NITMO|nr:substrate-binding domain-containing protein [Nitrospira moscoviensis]ALA60113.1 putative Phosphate-binding protein PstS [Nitrospira moscoviensis]
MGRLQALSASVLFVLLAAAPSVAGLTGRIVVAGYGPELPVMQDLGRAFEKAHPGTAIDFRWDRTVKAVELVKAGEAQAAVTDRPDPALKATPIAWEGIAVIVNFANPVSEVTTEQVQDLFTGKITRWSDLDGGDQPVEVLPRAPEDNVHAGLEASLGIGGRFQASGKAVRTDEKALRAVSGRDRAISYLSLAAALKAQEDGIPIRILTVDKVEPGQPTVKSGAYKLRRPVLILSAPQPDPLTDAFIKFAISPDGQKILQPVFVPYTAASVEWTPPPTHLTDKPAGSEEKQES